MNLSGFLPLIGELPSYRELLEAMRGKDGPLRAVLSQGSRPYLIAALYREGGQPLLVVTARQERARQLCDELAAWLGGEQDIFYFPEPDALPYERLPSDLATVQQRLRALYALSQVSGQGHRQAPLVVASAHALAQKTLSPDEFASACQVIRPGMRLERDKALAHWLALGYQPGEAVEAPGMVSRRGGIVDIYPPQYDSPVRIELLGDEVESLRLFDAETQRSTAPIAEVTIGPARELCPDGRPVPGVPLWPPEEPWPGLEFFYAGLFNRGALPHYLPQESLIILEDSELLQGAVEEMEAQAQELRRGQVERGELPPDFPLPYFPWPELQASFNHPSAGSFDKLRTASGHRRVSLALEAWEAEETHHLAFNPAPAYGGRLPAAFKEIKDMLGQGHRLLIVSQQASRLSELLLERDVIAPPLKGVTSVPAPGSLSLLQGSLAEGWTMGIASSPLTLLTDTELFGFTKTRRGARRHFGRKEALLSDLAAGDYVVHIEHGIGRFLGMARRSQDGVEREYLLLEYDAGDRLYVPSDQVDRVSRYVGPGGYVPSLSRLGGGEWARAKARVRESAAKLAQELLALYSAREVVPGFAFSPDAPWQLEMEASFPYVETPDQLEAIQEVKADMERPQPMDRLVCGDVGYGKTEVALRAAFKAVMAGKQVAVLVPTTVLAQQHLVTFTERLEAFPVTIEVLSRFRSEREQRAVVESLARGAVDIVIGTHRLLQKDISFKNLGLVVIDEEQRFGVGHKERLKQMRQEVDVLTLTATPIPRTLHMSLVGVRDMSTMETPPEERLPIKTYVASYEERLVREAILREMDRGGQVFFVHNRVRRIQAVARRLEELVPEARIAVGHGQMPEDALEQVMLDFSQGKSDVLVCTTIIESGLDLPNVNTIIIDQAHRMGLTQLYQLRGRVGRGANRAYAYFFYPKGRQLTETAEKRLRTIAEATELGSGFRIAMADLEIRGAGNLLGPEQSGQIGAVGFDLYCRLLAEAVEDLKAKQGQSKPAQPKLPAPTIDLRLTAHIPQDYIEDEATRLALYQRLALLFSPQEAEDMAREMEDRFGPLPRPAQNLLYVVRVKALASRAGFASLGQEEGQLVLRLREGLALDTCHLPFPGQPWLKASPHQVRLDLKRLGPRWPEMLERLLKAMGGKT